VLFRSLGGVGSWAAESLARSGVGRLTIIDFDKVCITNANRQLHSLQGLVGQQKAEVMGDRLRKINPQAQIDVLPIFYNRDNSEQIFSLNPDYIIDAIDNLTAKCHLLSTCRSKGIRVITSAGSAARLDPLRIKMTDLGLTHSDPMAHNVRRILRQSYEFPEKTFGIPCVFSDETPIEPVELKYDKGQGFKCVCPQGLNNLHNCDSRNLIWGTASFVTGSFGLTMASAVVRGIIGEKNPWDEIN
ncbi:MAG: ThiF family adenylyltransferase, partial [Pseudobdellovibrionaceae bacterium]